MTETMSLTMLRSELGEYEIWVVGMVGATHYLDYGTTPPTCSTVFTGFTRISGDDGNCDSVGPAAADSCPATTGPCNACKCQLAPTTVKVVIAGFGGDCTTGCSPGNCTDINGTYILDFTPSANCLWVGSVVNVCRFSGALQLRLIAGNYLTLFIDPDDFSEVPIASNFAPDFNCLGWNNYELSAGSSCCPSSPSPSVVITAMP
ncbi:hypothetical protein M0R72_09135 [Candidatus Pacearchaeota archaeon]|jgi:hypothetical protein|nr:hypothetical protein [Candidatus Pacearchaeota archaeon]